MEAQLGGSQVGTPPRSAGSQHSAPRQGPLRLPPWSEQLEAPDALAGSRKMPSVRETYY